MNEIQKTIDIMEAEYNLLPWYKKILYHLNFIVEFEPVAKCTCGQTRYCGVSCPNRDVK